MNVTAQGPRVAERAEPRPESKTEKPNVSGYRSSYRPEPKRSSNKMLGSIRPALALLSLGLGVLAITKPRRVTKLVGVRSRYKNVVRAMGVREIGHAVAIMASPKPQIGVWSRVAGDALDLSGMALALRDDCTRRERSLMALGALAGITAVDVLAARQLQKNAGATADQTVTVAQSVVINQPAARLYAHWHNFENLPQFMEHLERVEVRSNDESHWVAHGPAGTSVAWDARITNDRPDRLIAWTSLPGAAVPNWGQVTFEPAPGRRGTIVTVELEYQPPAGKLGKLAATLFGEEPKQQIHGDLKRFKEVMETGEVLLSDATLHGRRIYDQAPARPQAQ